MNLLPENELLQYVHKTADMGCSGLEDVLNYVESRGLKKVLNAQLTEYEKLRNQAALMLRARGETPSDTGAMAKISAKMMSAGKLMADRSDSKIAEMTIQGNTMGVTKTIKHLHDYAGKDSAVRELTKKLLATEEENARQLRPFL